MAYQEFEEGKIRIGSPGKKGKGAPSYVRPKKKSPYSGGGGVARIQRLVKRVPEVMVKVSGSTRGYSHMKEHLNYITRNGELVGETGSGALIEGRGDVKSLADEWFRRREVVIGDRQRGAKETVNMVFSMPAGTDREKVRLATARAISELIGDSHDYILVEHRDTAQPHVHVTILARGRAGERYNPRKADLQALRDGFAHELRVLGVEAESTPRRMRGVVRKPQQQVLRHLEMREPSKVQRSKVEQALSVIQGLVEKGQRPWEDATKKQQAKIRQQWKELGERFFAAGGDSKNLAGQINQFLESMPLVMTEREILESSLALKLEKNKKHSNDKNAGR
jgi:type IV secretion system T-DNA border endonuclease VirD2